MGYYNMNMDKEAMPEAMLPEGWRELKCKDMIPEVSKAGNDMFITTFIDVKSGKEKKVWLVSVEGKRWLLKQLLSACGIERNAEGNFSWDFSDIINKSVLGYVQVEDETFIDRKGETVTKPKSKIVEFKKFEGKTVSDPSEIAWEE